MNMSFIIHYKSDHEVISNNREGQSLPFPAGFTPTGGDC